MSENREKRRSRGAIRAKGTGLFFGTAVVYDSWSELLSNYFRERIMPGTFDECLARSDWDIFATLNHNLEYVLGRKSSGTLRLKPGDKGIDVEVDASGLSYARDLAISIRRKDMAGMSFIFDVLSDTWENKDGVPHRTITKADIYEVSFVFEPAYQSTTVGMRSMAAAKAVMEKEQPAVPLSVRKRRLQLLDRE